MFLVFGVGEETDPLTWTPRTSDCGLFNMSLLRHTTRKPGFAIVVTWKQATWINSFFTPHPIHNHNKGHRRVHINKPRVTEWTIPSSIDSIGQVQYCGCLTPATIENAVYLNGKETIKYVGSNRHYSTPFVSRTAVTWQNLWHYSSLSGLLQITHLFFLVFSFFFFLSSSLFFLTLAWHDCYTLSWGRRAELLVTVNPGQQFCGVHTPLFNYPMRSWDASC